MCTFMWVLANYFPSTGTHPLSLHSSLLGIHFYLLFEFLFSKTGGGRAQVGYFTLEGEHRPVESAQSFYMPQQKGLKGKKWEKNRLDKPVDCLHSWKLDSAALNLSAGTSTMTRHGLLPFKELGQRSKRREKLCKTKVTWNLFFLGSFILWGWGCFRCIYF